MSLFGAFAKRAKLNSAIKQTAEARKSEAGKADQLFKRVYQGYAEVVSDHPMLAEALYNWGFALLHHAKLKSGEEAAALYQEAISKFAFCLTLEPYYLGAAIDGGVAYMDLARVKGVKPEDHLYDMAEEQFEKANAIQAGSASYNLACIYALRGDETACLNALEDSRDRGSLPSVDDVMNDPDIAAVREQGWFVEFMEAVRAKKEAVPEEPAAPETKAGEELPVEEEVRMEGHEPPAKEETPAEEEASKEESPSTDEEAK
ncbi:TPR end-of-group domain-containing protein [Methylobacter sp.]|uniref:TPR end-of-group domain-containing protein n=1 Tax=Methylobacter sp. TaxID=2051955 RepID=UPI003DA452CA